MKVKEIPVKKLYISDITNLDPINVFIEEVDGSGGKFTIECYGKAWSYYWGGIGKSTLMEFFCNCDNHYLAGKFAPMLESQIDDPDGTVTAAREHILEHRRNRNFTREEARDKYNLTEYLTPDQHDNMFEVFGDEWWHDMPKQPNHEYEYLLRILDAVKEAIAYVVSQVGMCPFGPETSKQCTPTRAMDCGSRHKCGKTVRKVVRDEHGIKSTSVPMKQTDGASYG